MTVPFPAQESSPSTPSAPPLSDRVSCPSCGRVNELRSYDIGSGPEYCCPCCEWCWGAEGQVLDPDDARRVPRHVYDQLPEWARSALIPVDD